MATKKTVKKDEFIIMGINEADDRLHGTSISDAEEVMQTFVQEEGGDSFYQGREYCIYKLVKRVRVSIEHPLPVVKLIPVKD